MKPKRSKVPQMTNELRSVAGRIKPPEEDDPLELAQAWVPAGDPEIMARCLIEEYARLGMGEEEILRLFSRPVYQIHELYRQWGEARVGDLIRRVLSRTGRMRISVNVLHQIENAIPKEDNQNACTEEATASDTGP